MRTFQKQPKADLNRYYGVFLELSIITVLLGFIALVNLEIRPQPREITYKEVQETVHMEEIVRSKQEKRPSVPRPYVPVEVPDDEIVAEEIIEFDAELDFDLELELPPEPVDPQKENNEEKEYNFFVAVEQMPELIGGLKWIQERIKYPAQARMAGIEGRVIIQFIVSEEGKVLHPRVIRGIGGGCDEEALRVVKKARFRPGRQRDLPVKVQFAIPVIFKLSD
ncbi:MAG: TonB family protein [Balneolaceae bacterium]|nr:TonB family protein [Balneolaceae bacterium]